MPVNGENPNQESEEHRMSEYKLKTPKQAEAVTDAYHKVEDTVVSGYHKVEDTVTGAYKKVEDTVVGGYKAIEKKFVDAFLERAEDRDDGGDAPAGGKE